jgi:dihydroflavonol-4-reductase
MTRVLITGGLGFLGSHLVETFAAAGFDVRIFSRRGNRPPDYRYTGSHEIVWGDIRDGEAVDRAVGGTDLVVHTVSNFREARTDRDAYAINVGGTRELLRAARNHRSARIVLCSTIGVHGNVLTPPADESSPFNPGDIYQETKVAMEGEARAFEQETGIPVCILRPASLYGPGDLRMLKLFRMIQRGRFLLVGRGDNWFHPAYIDDVARAFVLAATSDRAAGETFIIGGEGYLRLRDLVAEIARHLEVDPPERRIPLAPLTVLARISEAVCRPLNLEPPLHRRRLSFFVNNRAFSIEKAKRVLGYRPGVPLGPGLERTIAWYEANGLLDRRAQASTNSLRPAGAVVAAEAAPAPDTTRSSL